MCAAHYIEALEHSAHLVVTKVAPTHKNWRDLTSVAIEPLLSRLAAARALKEQQFASLRAESLPDAADVRTSPSDSSECKPRT
jgi:hypothetical protein